MNDNNYSKGNGQYNNESYGGMNEDYFDYQGSGDGYGNNYYGNEDNYTVPLDSGMSGANSYQEKNPWSDFDQGRYGGRNDIYDSSGNYTNYMNDEYNYNNDYYGYEDQYSIDYGNSPNDYGNGGYDYTEYGATEYQSNFEPSLYEISNKLNETVDQEILYSSLINGSKNNNYGGNSNNYGDNNNYGRSNNSYGQNNNSYDNVTVGLDMSNLNSGSSNSNIDREKIYNSSYDNSRYDSRYDRSDDNYGGINSRSNYYHRNNTYDNKLIPTQDIVFDDAYVVRNQLFEEEDKLFTFNDLLSFLICIVFAVILAFLITRYVAQLTEVDGPSMSHNLQNKDDLLLDKFSYKVRDPKRYEIVVFPVDNDNFYIKRIIGLPGEKVDVQGAKYDSAGNLVEKSKIYINGKELTDEIYGFEEIAGTAGDNAHCTLGEDEYYVMGDNRNNSTDSRRSELGAVKGSDFVGRAIFRVFPLNSIGPIDNHINEKIYNGDAELKAKYNVQ